MRVRYHPLKCADHSGRGSRDTVLSLGMLFLLLQYVMEKRNSLTTAGVKALINENTPESAQFTLLTHDDGSSLALRGAKLLFPSCE